MRTDFSWDRSARQYVEVYYRALAAPGEIPPQLQAKLRFVPAPEGANGI